MSDYKSVRRRSREMIGAIDLVRSGTAKHQSEVADHFVITDAFEDECNS